MAAIPYSWPDLILVKIEHVSKSLVFSGGIQGTDHSCSIFNGILLIMNALFPKTPLSEEITLNMGMFIDCHIPKPQPG